MSELTDPHGSLHMLRTNCFLSSVSFGSRSHRQQRGATGKLSGPGEKAITIATRQLTYRASRLTTELRELATRDDAQRQKRRRRDANMGQRLPVAAIVGYTNAGKSLLHAKLAGSSGDASRARDALFASLETSTVAARAPDGR